MSQAINRKRTFWVGVLVLGVLFMAPRLSPLEKTSSEKYFHPKVESSLWQLYQVYFASGKKAAKTFAKQHGIVFDKGCIQIVAEIDPAPSAQDLQFSVEVIGQEIEALGGWVETSHRQLVQNSIPLDSLFNLAEFPSTRYLRLPLRPISLAKSEGVSKTGADLWQGLNVYRGGGQPAKNLCFGCRISRI